MAPWVKYLPWKQADLCSDKGKASKAKWRGMTCL